MLEGADQLTFECITEVGCTVFGASFPKALQPQAPKTGLPSVRTVRCKWRSPSALAPREPPRHQFGTLAHCGRVRPIRRVRKGACAVHSAAIWSSSSVGRFWSPGKVLRPSPTLMVLVATSLGWSTWPGVAIIGRTSSSGDLKAAQDSAGMEPGVSTMTAPVGASGASAWVYPPADQGRGPPCL